MTTKKKEPLSIEEAARALRELRGALTLLTSTTTPLHVEAASSDEDDCAEGASLRTPGNANTENIVQPLLLPVLRAHTRELRGWLADEVRKRLGQARSDLETALREYNAAVKGATDLLEDESP